MACPASTRNAVRTPRRIPVFSTLDINDERSNPPRVVKLASNALTGADPADILGRFKRKIFNDWETYTRSRG